MISSQFKFLVNATRLLPIRVIRGNWKEEDTHCINAILLVLVVCGRVRCSQDRLQATLEELHRAGTLPMAQWLCKDDKTNVNTSRLCYFGHVFDTTNVKFVIPGNYKNSFSGRMIIYCMGILDVIRRN